MEKSQVTPIETEVMSVDDGLYVEDLTIERALAKLPDGARDDYGRIYHWFQEHSETIGTRMYGHGERLNGAHIPHAAQRGIHKPAGQQYALTITSSGNRFYDKDRDLIHLPDGTWLLIYSAQINNKGDKETNPEYNDSLIKCLVDGVPVGVFLEVGNGRYFRSLAFVEKYDPLENTFTLHGPVVNSTEASFQAPARQVDGTFYGGSDSTSIDLERDTRDYEQVRLLRRKGQEQFRANVLDAYGGQCAISNCNVREALQAAHIFPYRGTHTNTTSNGLLLRADLHLLFDAQLLSVDPEHHQVHISEYIDYPDYLRFNNRDATLPSSGKAGNQDEMLDIHFKQFLMMEELRQSH